MEGVLNSRPLTCVYPDQGEPLTRSHLVLGKRILTVTAQENSNLKGEGRNKLLTRNKHLRNVLQHFWKRWQSEYLTHHNQSKKNGPKIQVGDVVRVQEDMIKRLNWTIAVIESLIRWRDGNVRKAIVRMVNKAGKITTTRRAVQRLYPIEVTDSEHDKKTAEIPITFVERAVEESID